MKECVPEKTQNKTHQEMEIPDGMKNHEISIDYVNTGGLWNRNKIENMDEIFSYSVACDIVNGNEDPESRSVIECQNRHDWIK